MNEIINGVWIAGIQAVREAPTQRFDTVITVCQESVSDNVGCEYNWFTMADGPDNTYGGDASYELFHNASDALYNSVMNDETVLIHCHKGQSRSVSVAAAVLGRIENISFDTALTLITLFRPQANPDELLQAHGRTYINEHK